MSTLDALLYFPKLKTTDNTAVTTDPTKRAGLHLSGEIDAVDDAELDETRLDFSRAFLNAKPAIDGLFATTNRVVVAREMVGAAWYTLLTVSVPASSSVVVKCILQARNTVSHNTILSYMAASADAGGTVTIDNIDDVIDYTEDADLQYSWSTGPSGAVLKASDANETVNVFSARIDIQ